MTTMDTYTSLMSAKTNPITNLPSETSKITIPSLDNSQDFAYYQSSATTRVNRVCHDSRLIEFSDRDNYLRALMDSKSAEVQRNGQIKQESVSGREKLERHWNDVAGRVCIPEKWGQENFLKDWMDHSMFDSLLAPKGVGSAREALVAERRRENSNIYLSMADKNGKKVLSFT